MLPPLLHWSIRPSDKTLIEVHRHLGWMSRALREATELAQRHDSLDAALAEDQSAPGARIIQVFVRTRPEQPASKAISTFEAARLRYDEDAARLEPYLLRYGLRTLKSVSGQNASGSASLIPPAEFAQKIRQSRHATRRLPDLLASLRAILPQPLVDEITAGPIEEAHGRLREFRASDPRARAAMELRDLRSLFAETGFGDVLSPPPLPEGSAPAALVRTLPPRYSPEFLDLLLEIDAESDCSHVYECFRWPQSLERARTSEELASLAVIGKRFDVVVTDDADRFNLDTLECLARLRLHRLGVTASSGNISLEQGSQAGESISVQLERADTVGLVYVEAPEFEANALAAGAERLAEHLRRLGINAVVAPHEGADTPALLIASADTAEEKRVRRLLNFALDGAVVLCRSWRPDPDVATPLSADARAALHLGWRVRKTFADGLLLEKDGRVAALVNESQGELPTDELTIDLIRRVEARGWSPIVCWRDAPRDPADLARLLQGRSTALDKTWPSQNLSASLISLDRRPTQSRRTTRAARRSGRKRIAAPPQSPNWLRTPSCPRLFWTIPRSASGGSSGLRKQTRHNRSMVPRVLRKTQRETRSRRSSARFQQPTATSTRVKSRSRRRIPCRETAFRMCGGRLI